MDLYRTGGEVRRKLKLLLLGLAFIGGVSLSVVGGIGACSTSGRQVLLLDRAMTAFSSSSYHVLIISTGKFGDDVDTIRDDVYFQPPDRIRRLRVFGDGRTVEEILIREEAWKREAGILSSTNADILKSTLLGPISILGQRPDKILANEVGDDLPRGGEATKRYRYVDEAFGEKVVAANTSNDLYSDVRLTIDLIVGKNTGRIYLAQGELQGKEVNNITTWIVEYDVVFDIEAPS